MKLVSSRCHISANRGVYYNEKAAEPRGMRQREKNPMCSDPWFQLSLEPTRARHSRIGLEKSSPSIRHLAWHPQLGLGVLLHMNSFAEFNATKATV